MEGHKMRAGGSRGRDRPAKTRALIPILLLTLLRKIQEEQKITVGFWVLLGSVMTACCLASTMGALLACMLVGTAGLCGAVSYRKWKLILPLIGCCIPCIVYAGMYLLLG